MSSPFLTGYQGYFNPRQVVEIAQGAQESSVIDTGGMSLQAIILPPVMTGTALTFQTADSPNGFQAQGQVRFTGPPSDGDTLTIAGTVITFVASGPTGNQVLIGGSAALTAANLQAFLVASSDLGLQSCTYSTEGAVTMVTAGTAGTAGNAITFVGGGIPIVVTPSGGVLTGGGFRPVYSPDNSALSVTVAANRCYAFSTPVFQGLRYLKIVSGTAEAADRTLICSLKGL